MDAGLGLGPDPALLSGTAAKKAAEPDMTPMAMGLSLVFDTTTWSEVKVSTADPARVMAKLLRQGCYRLEIIQLVLMARGSGKALAELTAKRKDGKTTLRDLSRELGIDYDPLVERARVLAAQVEAEMEYVSRIRTGPAASEEAPAAGGPSP